jgi:hypothetical protein
MTDWTAEELEKVGSADELEVAPLRSDGTPRPYVPIWVVRVGDDLYVRSYRGRAGAWYRSAVGQHEGRIRAGGVERAVTFEPDGASSASPGTASTDTESTAAVDDAYRAKYARYGGSYLDPMLRPEATETTLRLVAR